MPRSLSPGIMLATSMQAQPGVYAVLLGSGVSTGAGIPTAWGIVRNLVARVATQTSQAQASEGERWLDDPQGWWLEQFAEPLGYSSLLARLAPTPAARQGLLAPFFEPTDEERAEGQKQPSQAHRALADLVKQGFVHVIVTTNFDRLTEQALSAAGVEPQVISRPEATAGMRPLAHAQATVIKLHGDYQDVESLNTDEELATYPEAWTTLLRQIFDEYGLIVCGWSADWDKALVRAIEQASSRRYPLYWDARSGKSDSAARLLTSRQGHLVDATDADQMFTELLENVQGLTRLAEPPLTTDLAVTRLKRYLPDPVRRIDLHDLVLGYVEPVRVAAAEVGPSVYPDPSHYQEAVNKLTQASEPLLRMLTNGVLHDDGTHDRLWVRTLQALLDLRGSPQGGYNDATVDIQHLPAQLALYTMAAMAVAEHRDGLVLRLSTEPTWSRPSHGESVAPAGLVLHGWHVLDADLVNKLPMWGSTRWLYPRSHLRRHLLEPIVTSLVNPARFNELLDDVEYRLGLLQWCDPSNARESKRPHTGEFVSEGRWDYDEDALAAEQRLRADLSRPDAGPPWLGVLGESADETLAAFLEYLKARRTYA